jgi:hypothetical protein
MAARNATPVATVPNITTANHMSYRLTYYYSRSTDRQIGQCNQTKKKYMQNFNKQVYKLTEHSIDKSFPSFRQSV